MGSNYSSGRTRKQDRGTKKEKGREKVSNRIMHRLQAAIRSVRSRARVVTSGSNQFASGLEPEGKVLAPLVPLLGPARRHAADEPNEITLYVKGFLAPREEPDDFESWSSSHMVAHDVLGWSRTAAGIQWQSGEFYSVGKIPLPIASGLAAALSMMRRTPWSLPGLAAIGASEIGIMAARIAWQWNYAQVNAQEAAVELANRIEALQTGPAAKNTVRVVAHSLGCSHVLHACSALHPELRPRELHLCAPAITGEDFSRLLAEGPLAETVYVYYSPYDAVLSMLYYTVMRGNHALGAVGPTDEHMIGGDVRALDSSDVFRDGWVHGAYGNRFSELAVASARSGQRVVAPPPLVRRADVEGKQEIMSPSGSSEGPPKPRSFSELQVPWTRDGDPIL